MSQSTLKIVKRDFAIFVAKLRFDDEYYTHLTESVEECLLRACRSIGTSSPQGSLPHCCFLEISKAHCSSQWREFGNGRIQRRCDGNVLL